MFFHFYVIYKREDFMGNIMHFSRNMNRKECNIKVFDFMKEEVRESKVEILEMF